MFARASPRIMAKVVMIDHRMAWAELIKSGELELNEDTVLITELFVLVKD